MAICNEPWKHRWSTIKRWKLGEKYFIIQRCRKCDEWIRREIKLFDESLQMSVKHFSQSWVPMNKKSGENESGKVLPVTNQVSGNQVSDSGNVFQQGNTESP